MRVAAQRIEGEKLRRWENRKVKKNLPTSHPPTFLSSRADFIEISVTDTGIGIKPEDLPKLFREFTRLEAPITKKFRGAGLGLALTKKLVELHAGRIWVKSEFGKGNKFVFVMPVKQSGRRQ